MKNNIALIDPSSALLKELDCYVFNLDDSTIINIERRYVNLPQNNFYVFMRRSGRTITDMLQPHINNKSGSY